MKRLLVIAAIATIITIMPLVVVTNAQDKWFFGAASKDAINEKKTEIHIRSASEDEKSVWLSIRKKLTIAVMFKMRLPEELATDSYISQFPSSAGYKTLFGMMEIDCSDRTQRILRTLPKRWELRGLHLEAVKKAMAKHAWEEPRKETLFGGFIESVCTAMQKGGRQ
jgi:hypothetical protein